MNELIVAEILRLAYQKNHKERNTIFINFSGHVCWFEIKIYFSGWNGYADADYEEEAHFDETEKLKEILDRLKSLED